jgi:NadR type nicotinamide-nucleotide adenylyltransferase
MEKTTEDDIIKVVLIGSESTGKTNLSEFLANEFNTIFVPEFAREYIENLNSPYTYEDVEYIAHKQVTLEGEYLLKANKIIFYDTYLIITKIWFEIVYKRVPEWIDERIKKCNIDLFLLCNNDIEWIADSVRENGGEMRDNLFKIYENELIKYGFNYRIVNGKGENRIKCALNHIQEFTDQKK